MRSPGLIYKPINQPGYEQFHKRLVRTDIL